MLCKCSGKYIDIYFILKITYYLSSSIFGLKISYIFNMLKYPPPPVFLKPFLLDDVKNQTEG